MISSGTATASARNRWERLQGSRRTSDFVRHLLDREEEDRAKGDPHAILARVLAEQSRLPAAWFDDGMWGGESAGADVSPIPDALRRDGATLDVGAAQMAGLMIGPR